MSERKARKARPSGMKTAQACALSPWLAVRHQMIRAEIGVGLGVDAEVTEALRGGSAPRSLAAIEIVEWVRAKFPGWSVEVQRTLELEDQEMGELLTRGTPDLLAHATICPPDVPCYIEVHVADWKKKGQLFAGYLDTPDEHPQTLSYGLAAALKLDAAVFQVHHVLFNGPDDDIDVRSSRRFEASEFPALLERFRAMPDVDLEGPEPPATEGKHCDTCWQQRWCTARLLPPAVTALEPFTVQGGLTHDRLPEAIAVLEKFDASTRLLSKKAWEQVQGLVQLHGPVRVGDREFGFFEKKGKRSGPKVEELIKMGHGDLVKPAEVTIGFTERKVTG